MWKDKKLENLLEWNRNTENKERYSNYFAAKGSGRKYKTNCIAFKQFSWWLISKMRFLNFDCLPQ